METGIIVGLLLAVLVGISLGLLTRTLHAMAADGCATAGIGVDTIDPASPATLAEELGYEFRDGLVLMSRTLGAEGA